MRVLARTMTSMDGGGLAAWKVPEKVGDDGKKKGGGGSTKVLPRAEKSDLDKQQKSNVKE